MTTSRPAPTTTRAQDDEAYLNEVFQRDDPAELLDRAVSDLVAGVFNPRLTFWLATQLERILAGEDAAKVFKLIKREGAPRGLHGAGRFDDHRIAALTVLARRRFGKKADADAAVARAVGWEDPQRVLRHIREYGYSLDDRSDDDLIAMCGDELLKRAEVPAKTG